MQERHTDRERYFKELAQTSKEFYIDYLQNLADRSELERAFCKWLRRGRKPPAVSRSGMLRHGH